MSVVLFSFYHSVSAAAVETGQLCGICRQLCRIRTAHHSLVSRGQRSNIKYYGASFSSYFLPVQRTSLVYFCKLSFSIVVLHAFMTKRLRVRYKYDLKV